MGGNPAVEPKITSKDACAHPPKGSLWPSNACVQATLGVGSVNFCTVDFGGAFFNWSYCVPCVLPDTLVLTCMIFIFCVRAALLAKRAFVACFTSWFSLSTRVSRKLRRVSNTLVQATLGVGSVNFWSFTVAWTRGGGGAHNQGNQEKE